MTISCMGGFCTARETCPNYNAEDRSNPVERMCDENVDRPVRVKRGERQWKAKAVQVLLEKREITARALSEILTCSKPSARRILKDLYEEGLVNRRSGETYNGNITNIYVANARLEPVEIEAELEPVVEEKPKVAFHPRTNSIFNLAKVLL